MPQFRRARSAAIWLLAPLSIAFCIFVEFLAVAVGGTAPTILAWCVYAAVVTLALLFLKRRAHFRGDWVFIVAAAIVPVVVSLWEWDARKAFTRDLGRIHPGMSRADAEAIMHPWIRGSGFPANPLGGRELHVVGGSSHAAESQEDELTLRGCEIFRHQEIGNSSADWGIVCYRDGTVSSVEFSPD